MRLTSGSCDIINGRNAIDCCIDSTVPKEGCHVAQNAWRPAFDASMAALVVGRNSDPQDASKSMEASSTLSTSANS
jgi:hypothetical protein